MNYIFSISQAMLDRVSPQNHHSNTIIVTAVRDLLLLAESQLINKIMVRTAENSQKQHEPYSFEDLINSLKNTDRDIQDVLRNIGYLRQNNEKSVYSSEQQREMVEKTTIRLAQLRDEAVIIKDYKLAHEIEKLFSAIGLLN